MKPLENLLRAHEGPMTSELVLRPGDFGLGRVPARLKPVSTTNTVCGFCSTGCSLRVHLDAAGQAVNLTPDPDYPVNLGMACPKGWEALAPLAAADRVTTPLLRAAGGRFAPVGWEQALRTFCGRLKHVQARHGPHSVAVLSTGQIVTEEMALLGALTKFGMGLLHLDSNTRQCMATTHVAYKESFGFDAPPFTYADFEESDVLVFIGANPCIAHPIMWQRVMSSRRQPLVIVVDPRRTETAMAAGRHYAIQPKSDLTLLYGLAHLLINRGAADEAFIRASTDGYEAFALHVRDFPPSRVCAATGLTPEELEQFAAALADREKRVSYWWTMGVNQGHESTRTAQAIINLALLTGQIGRPGTGPNSITGQCNAMGSRLYGNATSLLGGYDFADAEHRAHVARVLGLDAALIPSAKSWAYDQIVDGIESGQIRGLWVIATDPAHSWINQGRLAALRSKLEFLVVQDMYATTRTAQLADLILPAAGWGEKEGVLINSERRLGLVRKVARAPGAALSDFAIFKLIAEYWGCGKMFARWSSPEAVFQLLKELSRGQPCDFSGVRDYAHLAEARGIQWPWTEASEMAASGRAPQRQRRLFADGRFFTPRRRARFVFDHPRPMPEEPDGSYPFLLLTGRGTSAQWHTGSRTDKSAVLRKLAPRGAIIEINPVDARRLVIRAGDRVLIQSRRGEMRATAVVTPTVQAGQVFIPMHDDQVNRLTFAAFDPHSRQPSYKACAVRLKRAIQERRST
ncbi:MAG: molybdopterin-dependent oxidoreductase [Opitutae bacterium]|nr:molybdopterin-dependent oxidoreductase [Opitutae bacterium]